MLLARPNYQLSLRIYHPFIDPIEITQKLGLSPYHSWMKDQQRTTPRGTLLEGLNKNTYWVHSFDLKENTSLNDGLEQILEILHGNQQIFQQIFNDGGRSELYTSLFFSENMGDIIKWSILKRLADLRIDLAVELFQSHSI